MGRNERESSTLHILHSSLERVDGNGLSSRCPSCVDGVLATKRDAISLAVIPDDTCTLCGQKFHYLDLTIGGVPVMRLAARPAKKKDWVGRRVRLRMSLRNKAGDLFRAGEIMEVQRNFGGLELRSLIECNHCYHGRSRTIKQVSETQVELLSQSLSSMADNRDPSLILMAVRKVLADGLKYHEHDGHLIPKRVVQDALVVLGVPEESQP